MSTTPLSIFADQLDALIEEYRTQFLESAHDDRGDLGDAHAQSLISRLRSAIDRSTRQGSAFRIQSEEIMSNNKLYIFEKLLQLSGVADGLARDIRSGALDGMTELIHADIFGDFLEMAEHLLQEGYKDAAAVIAGGSLEAHLRAICVKNGIAIERQTTEGIKSKKADALNGDLYASKRITGLEHKSVTSWLDLRNKAAHGRYNEYGKEQVDLFISGIRNFLSQNPA